MGKKIAAIYAAGLIQGLTLVAFPAASTIFTNPHAFNFSSTTYGSLFIPQAIISIVASLFSAKLGKLVGSKFVYLLGLGANFLSMLLLAFSAIAIHDSSWAYGILMFATAFLGLGFGFTVPTINTMAALLYPQKVDSIILILNALLGFGTALSPLFIAFFVAFGFWWGLPVFLVCLIILLFLFSMPLTLPGGKINTSYTTSQTAVIPLRFWIFAFFALLYGVVETLNGNWVLIYMREYETANITIQSLALTVFWGMVTIGRIFFALIHNMLRQTLTYCILPFIASVAFILIASLPSDHEYWGVFAFGLAGFGCSALLPLTISFGNAQLRSISTSVAAGVIAFYLLGYGIAAFGVGPLKDNSNLSLRDVYAIGVFIAFILGMVSFFIVRDQKTKREEKI